MRDVTISGIDGTVIINGHRYHGKTIVFDGDTLEIDGNKVAGYEAKTINISISGDVTRLETVNGNVTCRDADIVKTVNGNVTTHRINGSAKTVNGNIQGL